MTLAKWTKWDTIAGAVKARQYGRAIKGMYNASAGSKRHFLRVVGKIIRKEVSVLLQSDTNFTLCQNVNMETLENFSWNKTCDILKKSAPLLHMVLTAASNKAPPDKVDDMAPHTGVALSCLLQHRARNTANFIPTVFSIQFWRGGLKRDMIKQMSKTGLCVGYLSTLRAIDSVRDGFDAAAYKCKEAVENALANIVDPVANESAADLSVSLAATEGNIEDEVNSPIDSETDEPPTEDVVSSEEPPSPLSSSTQSDSEDDDSDEDHASSQDSSVSDEEQIRVRSDSVQSANKSDDDVDETLYMNDTHPGFTMCWDNVGKKVISRHPTEQRTNTYLNMALGYVAVNRIATTSHRPWGNWKDLPKAVDLPIHTFLPSEGDFDALRDRMAILVSRVICRHLPWFRTHFQSTVVKHIVHPYTLESSQRSALINLGIFKENPCSTQGAIGIYESLQKYVPSIDNKPYTTLVFGDGLSCERGNDAHKARSNGQTEWERLEGLEPAAQEFHKEMLLLQDYFDTFFKGASAMDRGTLSHLKNIFNFRQVKADTSDNFNHAWELMCVTTEGYICLLVKELLQMTNEERPPGAPPDIENASEEERYHYLESVCLKAVETIWHHTNVNKLRVDDGTGPPVYCCGEDLDEDIIVCKAGSRCTRGQYFHRACADYDETVPLDSWFCSDDCRRQPTSYQYCVCKVDLGDDEPMIGCSAEDKCEGAEWYHLKCVGIAEDAVPEGDWFCCGKCSRVKPKRSSKTPSNYVISNYMDHLRNYSCAITWCGLNLMTRRDAVREADGDAMMSHWKIDLVHFYASHHPKYLILAHRLCASVGGWLPQNLQEDLKHNRTVNYGGGIGRNLPLDFMNEILNRLFKDLLAACKGRYTDTGLERCSQIVGPLGEALDEIFDEKVIENEVYRHRRRDHNRDENVRRLIRYLSNDRIFHPVERRCHAAFPDFTFNENPKFPKKFPAKITALSKRLDRRRQVVLQ